MENDDAIILPYRLTWLAVPIRRVPTEQAFSTTEAWRVPNR